MEKRMRRVVHGTCLVLLIALACAVPARRAHADGGSGTAIGTALVSPPATDTPNSSPSPDTPVIATGTPTAGEGTSTASGTPLPTPTVDITVATAASTDTETETATPVPPATQTSIPLPTATTGPSKANVILSHMRGALQKARSARVAYIDVAHPVPGTTVTTSIQGDVAWAGNMLHEFTTVVKTTGGTHPKRVLDQQYELEIAGTHAAWRPGRLSWACERLNNVRVIDTLQAMQTPLRDERRLPDTVVNGVEVQHIRATGASLALAGTPRTTIDLYISSAHHLPVRVNAVTAALGESGAETVTEGYSHWGESVHISLPRACR
jgi:hypothetical protein